MLVVNLLFHRLPASLSGLGFFFVPPMVRRMARIRVFVDGFNLYHSLVRYEDLKQNGCCISDRRRSRRHPSRSAESVSMDLRYERKHLILRVFDDGSGFELEGVGGADGHYGILSMKERAEQAGASFTIATAPGTGTTVETVMPSP